METLKKNAANLLKVKTIVTLMLTIVFCVLALLGEVSAADFLTVFAVVIAFYFGTQTKKETPEGDMPRKRLPAENAPEQDDTVMENAVQPEAAMETLQPPDEMAPVGYRY